MTSLALKKYVFIMNFAPLILHFLSAEAEAFLEEAVDPDAILKKLTTEFEGPSSNFSRGQGKLPNLEFTLVSMIDMHEETGDLHLFYELVYTWQDERADSIIPANFSHWWFFRDGKSRIKMWIPSVDLMNRAKADDVAVPESVAYLDVYYYHKDEHAHLFWYEYHIAHIACTPDLTRFPFDVQTCPVVFGSQSKMIREFEHVSNHFDYAEIFNYSGNMRWDLLKVETQILNKTDKNQNFPYQEAVITVKIQRSTPLIAIGLLTPLVLCMLMSMTSFWAPTTGGGIENRVLLSFGSTVVSMAILLTLAEIIPSAAKGKAAIVSYAALALVISVFTLLHTIFIWTVKRMVIPVPAGITSFCYSLSPYFNRCLFLLPSMDKSSQACNDTTRLVNQNEDGEDDVASSQYTSLNATSASDLKLRVKSWSTLCLLCDRLAFWLYSIFNAFVILAILIFCS